VINPGGIRLGTSSLTTRGFKEEEFIEIGRILDKLIQIAINIQKISGKKLKDFEREMKNNKQLIIIQDDVILLTFKKS